MWVQRAKGSHTLSEDESLTELRPTQEPMPVTDEGKVSHRQSRENYPGEYRVLQNKARSQRLDLETQIIKI